MSEPSVQILDEKINSFIESQDKHNDKVTNAIDKMSEAISSLNTVHTEINHLSEKHSSLENSIEKIRDDVKSMNDRVITSSIQTEEYKHIKKLFIAFIVTVALGGGFMTKMTSDDNEKKDALMEEALKVMTDIAKSSGDADD